MIAVAQGQCEAPAAPLLRSQFPAETFQQSVEHAQQTALVRLVRFRAQRCFEPASLRYRQDRRRINALRPVVQEQSLAPKYQLKMPPRNLGQLT